LSFTFTAKENKQDLLFRDVKRPIEHDPCGCFLARRSRG
jgi:hypothetical protein